MVRVDDRCDCDCNGFITSYCTCCMASLFFALVFEAWFEDLKLSNSFIGQSNPRSVLWRIWFNKSHAVHSQIAYDLLGMRKQLIKALGRHELACAHNLTDSLFDL